VKSVLRFGIPSLDRIINNRSDDPDGIPIVDEQSTSVSIIGPDGVGKSVLGLHLAAHYLFDHRSSFPSPMVLYVSTDLSHSMANKRTWIPFALDIPGKRKVPFDDVRSPSVQLEGCDSKIELFHLRPLGNENSASTVAEFLNRDRNECEELKVGFVDLAANTAGDDWGFVNRVLASLPAPGQNGPKHLVILDAVEGIETLVGDLDAYGQISTRRNRIAQLMRSAYNRSHLVFIAEEPSDERRLPEQFVTDVVLRLRKRHVGDYIRRTLEVEKARGMEHVRGMHPYVIRSGRGSSTGSVVNWDDPKFEREFVNEKGKKRKDFQSYVHVFPSLHQYAREAMQKPGGERPQRPKEAFAAFGIHYLDSMLGGKYKKKVEFTKGYETSGLPCATVTALIGDSLTQKTKLGRAFLSRCFAQCPGRLLGIVEALDLSPKKLRDSFPDLAKKPEAFRSLQKLMLDYRKKIQQKKIGRWQAAAEILANAPKELHADSPDGAAILLTTFDVDQQMLVKEFSGRLLKTILVAPKDKEGLRSAIEEYCKSRTICRRLEVHDLPSPLFMHIVQRAVRGAQEAVLGKDRIPDNADDRFKESYQIRIVIDDFSAVLATYTEMRNDPLFLPALLFYLRREGVTSLIVDTHSGQPGAAQTDSAANELRTLVDQRLFTWHVPFFGENRVAIAAIPPLEDLATVRELRKDGDDLIVDPEFEMYSGFEERRPQPVPLEVRIHQETADFQEYMNRENLFFQSLFAPNTNRAGASRDIIVSRASWDYDSQRDFCYLDSNVRLDHTLVFEVDEYWATRKPNALADVGPYLRGIVTENNRPSATGDPFELFQPTESSSPQTHRKTPPPKKTGPQDALEISRYSHFPLYFDKDAPPGVGSKDKECIADRVPFCWDFGFMVCRMRAWDFAGEDPDVKTVWCKLRKVSDHKRPDKDAHMTGGETKGEGNEEKLREDKHEPVRWFDFLRACRRVAQAESVRTGSTVPALDLSLLSPESFSCLVLEIWASELWGLENNKAPDCLSDVTRRSWGDQNLNSGLIELLDEPDLRHCLERRPVEQKTQWLALYKTWLMLGETLDLSNLADPSRAFEFVKRNSNPLAVASRQWYKTASAENTFSPSDPTVLTQVPGRYSVRGDWFLAASGNSRSMRLAHRAIDILSSRRGNINRLAMGVGLPVRDIKPMDVPIGDLKKQSLSDLYEGPRTSLFKPEKGERHRVTYADLVYIGADSKDSPINWFWRSQLKDYDRHARVFHQWLCRMMIRLQQLKLVDGPKWQDGFTVVKELDDDPARFPSTASRTLVEFARRLNFLIADLKQASPWEPDQQQSTARRAPEHAD